MSVIVSFAPGPEGEAAVVEAASRAHDGVRLVIVCTVPTSEAREAAREHARCVTDARVVEVDDGEDAVERILDEIEAENPSLLVIGLRRRTPVGKLILGSSEIGRAHV